MQIALRDLFSQIPQQLLKELVGCTATEWLNIGEIGLRSHRPDLVARLTDGRLYHLELQMDNNPQLIWHMLEFYALLGNYFKQPPVQQVLYVGQAHMRMVTHMVQHKLSYEFQLTDIREMDCSVLLVSPMLEDNLLAILCRTENRSAVVRHILHKINQLEKNSRQAYLDKLQHLAGLRSVELQGLIRQEEAHHYSSRVG